MSVGSPVVLSLITGVGAKGQVGESVAAALAARGDTVLLVSRDAKEVEARAEDLRRTGGRASAYACDLSDPAAVDALAARVRADHGNRLDALVNLAGGFASSGPMAQSDPGVFARMMQINATTALLATRAFLPMLKTARGSIVFFASEVVVDGVRTGGVSAYAASKAAVVALMRSVADEGRGAGVRANALAPAAIRTASNRSSMGPEARYVEREDVAAAVAFLCSADAEAVSGQVIRLQ
jgi:NAD(P)-dependent dehydrogenase (short-subunit alcohol dehydrogenase family)